jgi:hypothetical protein
MSPTWPQVILDSVRFTERLSWRNVRRSLHKVPMVYRYILVVSGSIACVAAYKILNALAEFREILFSWGLGFQGNSEEWVGVWFGLVADGHMLMKFVLSPCSLVSPLFSSYKIQLLPWSLGPQDRINCEAELPPKSGKINVLFTLGLMASWKEQWPPLIIVIS